MSAHFSSTKSPCGKSGTAFIRCEHLKHRHTQTQQPVSITNSQIPLQLIGSHQQHTLVKRSADTQRSREVVVFVMMVVALVLWHHQQNTPTYLYTTNDRRQAHEAMVVITRSRNVASGVLHYMTNTLSHTHTQNCIRSCVRQWCVFMYMMLCVCCVRASVVDYVTAKVVSAMPPQAICDCTRHRIQQPPRSNKLPKPLT